MSIFKCKMCGGTLEINNESVATCEYCGTQQTIPKLSDDRRVNLYDRANHFRRNNEFDKAAGIYEQILNEDHTDAESYWSLVLCRYGIEYVEDPATHKRIPTVNRAQFTSIFDDDNYKSALQYADGVQRYLYEEEAKAINEIQKGILAISEKEEPFDIFICYKETDRNGRRTPDSVLAYDLYQSLTQEGFKVFFSRITLEDKLGVAYEPYIFAALNSAKVMVVLGTKQEYFNAVWVKNEWSRYLALIKNGAKKYLIPAYRDMNPYDLPDEFSHLQAQDMSKLGFMQDLIRGIKKLTEDTAPKASVKETVIVNGGNANTAPLLKRAFMFLEDGDWNSANEYCEKVLDIDPECAQAYLGKLMAERRVRKQEALKDCKNPLENSNHYHKAIRYAEAALKNELVSYNTHIKERNENARQERTYQEAQRYVQKAFTASDKEKEYRSAATLFASIPGYRDSDEWVRKCESRAEEEHKNQIYLRGFRLMDSNDVGDLEIAIKVFHSIRDWRDADQKEEECRRKIEQLTAEYQKRTKRTKIIVFVSILLIAVVVVVAILLKTVIFPMMQYDNATEIFANGNYDEAIARFEALTDYKDSAGKVIEVKYAKADKALLDKEYDAAIEQFGLLGDYRDSADKLLEATYQKAGHLREIGEYSEATGLYRDLGNYADSKELYPATLYESAEQNLKDGKVDIAESQIQLLKNNAAYKDKVDRFYVKLQEFYYSIGDYQKAVIAYKKTSSFEVDSDTYKDIYYKYGLQMIEKNELTSAIDAFGFALGYLDADELLTKCYYEKGLSEFNDKNYQKAILAFKEVENYQDSKDYIIKAKYAYVRSVPVGSRQSDYVAYRYLNELKKAKYKDSTELFEEYYSWKVELVCWNTDENDDATILKSIPRNNYYCHYGLRLTGGEPGEEADFYHVTVWPDGVRSYSDWDWEDRGHKSWLGCEWSDGFYAYSPGTMKIEIYCRTTRKCIGTFSIRIT